MKTMTIKTVEQTISEDVCELCQKKVLPVDGMDESDPSYKLQGYIRGEVAYHFCCIEEKLKV